MNQKAAKIYTIFLPHYFVKRDQIINKLQRLIQHVEFTGFDKLSGIIDRKGKALAYQNIKRQQHDLAGILVLGGFLDHQLTSFGLPVIFVRAIMGAGDWQKGILNFYQNEKVLSVALSEADLTEKLPDQRFLELADKIHLVAALNKTQQTRLLCLQEPEVLGAFDVYGMDFHVPLPHDYNDIYAKNLAELNLDIKHVNLIQLVENIKDVDVTKAEKIRNGWIKEASMVNKETNKNEILKAAKLYLAITNLMQKYNADGIAIRSLVPWSKGLLPVTPCLVNTELNKQLKVGVCEGLVNSAVTELFGIQFFRKPSFIGDVVGIDRLNNVVTFAHCQSPINPHGDDRAPYMIRSHALQKENKMLPDYYAQIGQSSGAAVKVDLPINESVTIIKMSIYNKKIAVSTGTTVSGKKRYSDFDERLCRTKLCVKTNTIAFEKHYDTVTFGVHRNIIFGDYREKIKDIATIIGYEIIEEDSL